ncbi:hypothetical protein FA10DRAFT_268753 [Acaromyces ingoldii]|uniref:Calcineurin-like phosphoesterase domain-containing protein n=1 Tax=Acaromyces ingoldii TaxID=215250 RepID=A0A316YHE8_9BASI|nr:hypothetical protein FA10DRAFT_268753 [Acaromyces ingoldii]PWN88571.1 hypothetical protein FA10DRAFT_268753 [Acaromyces ingoldii]
MQRPSRRTLTATAIDVLGRLLSARGSIHLLRSIALLVVFWYERLIFDASALSCLATPPTSPGSSSLKYNAPLRSVSIVLLADPQLIDVETYPRLKALPWPWRRISQAAVRWASDTYVRKAHMAVVRPSGRRQTTGTIVLGDLLDGARRPVRSVEEMQDYTSLVGRFRAAVPETVPSLYMPGNHDIRLPVSQDAKLREEYDDSRSRWLAHWGLRRNGWGRTTWSVDADVGGDRTNVLVRPKGSGPRVTVTDENEELNPTINARIPLYLDKTSERPSHEIIIVDSTELVGMQALEDASATTSNPLGWTKEAIKRFPSTYYFVEAIKTEWNPKKAQLQPQRILFSHIPLWREKEEECNWVGAKHKIRREHSGSLVQGSDAEQTYRNLISPDVSSWLMRSIKPDVIFSGDDHDHCEVVHSYASMGDLTEMAQMPGEGLTSQGIRNAPEMEKGQAMELTVKSMSMTEGVRRPGYARLRLDLVDDRPGGRFHPFANDPALAGTNASYAPSLAYVPCSLPSQLTIWTLSYPIWLLLVTLALVLDRRFRFMHRLDKAVRDTIVGWRLALGSIPDEDEDDDEVGEAAAEAERFEVGDDEEDEDEKGDSTEGEDDEDDQHEEGDVVFDRDDEETNGNGESWALVEEGRKGGPKGKSRATTAFTSGEGSSSRRKKSSKQKTSRGKPRKAGKKIRFGNAASPSARPATTLLGRISKFLAIGGGNGYKRISSRLSGGMGTSSNFGSRAWREIRRLSYTGEGVRLDRGPMVEWVQVIGWAIALWVWLQLF